MNNIAEWDDAQLSSHENIRRSFHKALPAILAGRSNPRVYAHSGMKEHWDRGPTRKYRVKPARIVVACCLAGGIDHEEFFSADRRRQVARTRQVACVIMKQMHPKMMLSEIAEECGYVDHTSVLHANKVIAADRRREGSVGFQIYYRAKRELVS